MTEENAINEVDLGDCYSRLMQLNQETFAGEQYDVAYHVLMAALHCAEALDDVQDLREVKLRANEQLRWIDAHHPEYHHSTRAAAERGQRASIYTNTARQAATRILMIERRR